MEAQEETLIVSWRKDKPLADSHQRNRKLFPTSWFYPCETVSRGPDLVYLSEVLSYRKYEKINLGCFKSLPLWSFVTASVGN